MTTRLLVPVVALFLGACVGAGDRRTSQSEFSGVSFLHLNDTYRVDAVEDGTRGGFARVVTVIRQLQEEGREVRLLHGGDFLYPSLESQLWNGEQMVEAFNFMHALAPLTVVPGNHEFDRSTADAAVTAIRQSDFAWVGANVSLESGDKGADATLMPETIVQVGGFRVGIFGLTLTPEDGGNEREYLSYADSYIASARESLERLQAADVDLVVGLTHLHLETDLELAELRREYPNFRLIFGGHEHEPEYVAATPTTAEVMKGASNARTIWRTDVDVDQAGNLTIASLPFALDEGVAQDPIYQVEIADKWRARLLEKIPFLPSRVGEAAVPFDAREVTIRNEESNWGNFVADQMRTAFGEPPADLAFINSGTLRIDDYIADDITFEDIARTFGFSSFLSYLSMNGAEFRETLEAGYRGAGPSKGYFPQVSGFRVCVDRSREEGKRIAQLQLPGERGWSSIDDEREYLVVAPEYLLRGGDGYKFPSDRSVSRPGSELKYLVLDAIVRASALDEKVGEAVEPNDPRIAFAPSAGTPCFH